MHRAQRMTHKSICTTPSSFFCLLWLNAPTASSDTKDPFGENHAVPDVAGQYGFDRDTDTIG